jgi:hypothetical protein
MKQDAELYQEDREVTNDMGDTEESARSLLRIPETVDDEDVTQRLAEGLC